MNRYDDLLQDTIDLHCHVDLEFSETLFRKRGPEDEWLPSAERSGMRGVVLKSHLWPTVSVVPFIKRLYEGPVEVWPSITLNGATGGIDLWSVEAAYHQGARTVFLPTWGSVNDLRNGGFHRRLADAFEWFRPERLCVQRVIDDDGKPTDDVRDLVRFCRDHGLTLATGHVSWQESLAVAEEAATAGLDRLICSHPLSNSVRAPLDAVRRVAELGAYAEVCWTNIAPGRKDPAEVVAAIREIGLDRVVVATDYFTGAVPQPSDLFRLTLGTLHDAGLTAAEIHQVAAENPARALGLE